MLFIPGANPKQLIFAGTMGSDSVIFDLEDSVSPMEKDAARILVRNVLKELNFGKTEIIVRVNSLNSPYWKEDLEEIVPLKPSLIMTPKTERIEDVRVFETEIAKIEAEHGIPEGTVGLIPLIETALGIENCFLIASCSSRVKAMLLGGEDYSADIQVKRTPEGNEINYARKRIVNAGRAAGVEIYDTPFTDAHDDVGIIPDAEYAHSLGFTGKSAISPRHVDAINAAFSPSEADIEYAKAVFETLEEAKREGRGVAAYKGKMIDAPVAARAKKVLETARELGMIEEEE